MAKYERLRWLYPLLLAGLLSGCAGAPVQEMSDARQAIRAARIAQSDAAQPVLLLEAERLVQEASDALAVGRYRQARAKALGAKQAALRARQSSMALRLDD